MDDDEERIALFLDYENLAIGARDTLGGIAFDLKPVLDALAERGRVIARKAYADWSAFDEDRRMLTRGHVELVEIPQRMGTSPKKAMGEDRRRRRRAGPQVNSLPLRDRRRLDCDRR